MLARLPEDLLLHALEWLDWSDVARLASCSKETRHWQQLCIAPEESLDAFRCPECSKPHKIHCAKLVFVDDMQSVDFGKEAVLHIPRYGDLFEQMNMVVRFAE